MGFQDCNQPACGRQGAVQGGNGAGAALLGLAVGGDGIGHALTHIQAAGLVGSAVGG